MSEQVLDRRALNRALLARQMLLAREAAGPVEAIERLVGLQAQQPAPPFVGLWSRIQGFRRQDLLDLLHARQVVRAPLMRATLHLMSAADYRAFRGALQPALDMGVNVLGDRMKDIDLAAVCAEAKRLFTSGPGTFNAVRDGLVEAFPGPDHRAMGYIARTRLPLVIAPDQNAWGFPSEPAFALAEDWLGGMIAPLAEPDALILRYLAAFGPASPRDFQTWSALPDARPAFERLRSRLVTFRDEKKRELFDLPEAPRPEGDTPAPPRLVAAFDNLVLGHHDRTRVIADEHRPRVVSKNLLVAATILVDGFVAGIWKAARIRKVATISVQPFASLGKEARSALVAEGEALARFIEPEASGVEVVFEAPQ